MQVRDGLVKGGYIEFSIVDRKNATQINQIVDELEGDDETNSVRQDKQIGDDDGTMTWQKCNEGLQMLQGHD